MILADVLAGYEKELEAIGEEPESISFCLSWFETMGFDSFTLRLVFATICWIISFNLFSDSNLSSILFIRPFFQQKYC